MEDHTQGPDVLARPPADARCAVHSSIDAIAVCRRCGNYMCRACSRDGTSPQCDSCRARGGTEFPFSRDRWSFSDLVTYCWRRFKAEWLMLSVIALIFIVLIYGIAFAVTFAGVMLTLAVPGTDVPDRTAAASVLRMSIQVAQFLLQILLQLWLQLGFVSVTLDVVEGRPAEVGRLFTRFDRFPAALLQLLIIYAGLVVCALPLGAIYFLVPGDGDTQAHALLAGSVVLGIPAAYVALGCAFAMPEIVHDPNASAIQALRTSFQIVHGHRLAIIGAVILIALIAAAGVIACCVGVIPAVAFGTLFYCSLYLALRTPTPRENA